MALTAKPNLHPRQRADGTYQVRIRLTLDRISFFLDSGFNVLKRDWNPKGSLENTNWVRKGEPNNKSMNRQLYELVYRALDYSAAYPQFTAKEVRDYLMMPSGESEADLERKRKNAELARQQTSNWPVVLACYEKLLQRQQRMQRELSQMQAQLREILKRMQGPASAT